MISDESALKLIRFASRAPSGHNTQAWKFKYDPESISILPDFERSLPVADSDNHELYISLGCALENLLIAAARYNYDTSVETETNQGQLSIRVKLNQSRKYLKSDLFDYISARQVTRAKYKRGDISHLILEEIERECREEGIQLRFITDESEIESLLPYVTEANKLLFSNSKFVDELIDWIRFSKKEVMLKGDGLWSASLNLPATGRKIGSFFLKQFTSGRTESLRMKTMIKSASGLVLFLAKENEPHHWIRLGRAFQRFGLLTTKYRICHDHVNTPCQVVSVREKLMRGLQTGSHTPLLLTRIGFSQPMPYSFRRNIHELLMQ